MLYVLRNILMSLYFQLWVIICHFRYLCQVKTPSPSGQNALAFLQYKLRHIRTYLLLQFVFHPILADDDHLNRTSSLKYWIFNACLIYEGEGGDFDDTLAFGRWPKKTSFRSYNNFWSLKSLYRCPLLTACSFLRRSL